MGINVSVYGAADTWYDSDFQQADLPNKNKTACFDSTQGVPWSTLGLGVDAGRLSWNEPINKSLSFCGLGRESALSTVCYYDNSGQIIDTNERPVTNFAFFEKSNDVPIYSDNTFFDTNHMDYLTWQDGNNFTRTNYNRQLKPLTRVNPKNIVLSLHVIATNNNITASVNVTLKEYLANYTTTYPLIHNVYYKYWYGNVAEISRRDTLPFAYLDYRRPLLISILDTYDIPSKNLSFNAYDIDNPAIFGNISTSPYISNNDTTSFRMIYCTPTAKEHIVFRNVNNLIYGLIEYYSEFEEDILKSVACFGLYFTPNDNICELGALTDNDMYIGILGADGVGHGQYLRGANTANAPQNNYTDMSQSGYDYTKEVDKTKYKNDTQFNTSLSLGAFTKFYQLTESQVNDLCTALYTAVNAQPSGTPIEEYNMKCFLTNNPIDCIISLKKFPLNHFPSVAGVIDDVYLGTVDSGIDAPRVLSTTWVYYFDFSNSNDTGLYPVNGGDFRDYEPYTTVQINVPFCGSFEVPTTYFYKYGGVRVALMIDFVSGACTAYLIVNGDVVDSVSGACAVDLPVTGLQSATLDGNIHSAAMAEKSAQTSGTLSMVAGAISIGAGIVTGNPLLAIGGVTALVGGATSLEKNQSQIDYDVQHMQLPLKQVGAASGAIAQCGDYRCKMIIKRPVMLNYDDEVYAKTIGYACLLNGYVSNFHGLTYGEIDLSSIDCSESEKEMIKSAFASGVYLP